MTTYLEEHTPRVRQFRRPRRARPSGLIVVHTAESVLDQTGEDTGAEGVAAFIANRTDFGSYHTIVDSDSRVRLVPFDAEAYGDGTGSNPYAIHISFACKAAGWRGMSDERRAAMIAQGAEAAAEAARWLRDVHGIAVPAVQITRAQSELRQPGFISHGARDPGRRTDPGVDFPWAAFLLAFVHIMTRPQRRAKLTAQIKALRAKISRLIERRKAL